MDPIAFLAALGSALTYALWNAAVRARPDPGLGFAVIVVAAGFTAFPIVLWTGLPDLRAWPWMVGGMVFNLIAMRAMMATYRRTPFAVGFPIARGLTPPMVALAALAVDGEVPSLLAVVGILAVSAALTLLGLNALRRDKASLDGLAMAAMTSVFTACYVFLDAKGARASGNILAYGCLLAVLNAILMAILQALEGRSPLRFTPRDWVFGLLVSIVSMTSYLLLLYAFTHGPIGPLSALRETSVLFATALAAWLLKERVGGLEWVCVMIAVAGIAILRMS